MSYININIKGVPYSKNKARGNLEGSKIWKETIIAQTKDLPCVNGPCTMRITFLMPHDKYPKDFPYGPNLDNQLEIFQDALKKTIFRNAPGGDSCIISLEVSKVKVESNEESGAHLEILPH